MFYRVHVRDHVRVTPGLFGLPSQEAIVATVKKGYEGYISKDLGLVLGVSGLKEHREGVIIPGDGSAYYDCDFELITFKPELQEVTFGKIKDVADFGAFINVGVVDGMIHISQAMDDFVSFGSDKVLLGKESKRSLKVGDKCKARVIAVSFKDIANPKIGLTMRQAGLGKLEWIEEDIAKEKEGGKKEEKGEEKAAKKVGRDSKEKPAAKKERKSAR
ncbi:DNA-directed RNA polymerase [Candidatus Woesearchaeota archaeon]|nr:DNA-directed RNA polymerase [Candidatus Woesearchaeota archaeon]